MPQDEKLVPLRWHFPDDMHGVYASQFVIQHTDKEFYISFFDAPPPLIVGSEEERKRMVDELDEVVVSCVARLVVHPERLPELIAMLQKNYDSFAKRYIEEATDDGDG